MLVQGDAIGLWTIGLLARIDCVMGDCSPKAMPLGYGLEGLSARIDCGDVNFVYVRIYKK